MNEERMSILNMLADGKITSEEADELLRALGRGERQEEPEPVPQPAPAEVAVEPESSEAPTGWKAHGWLAGGPDEQTLEAPGVIILIAEGEGGGLSIRGIEGTSVHIKGSAGVARSGETLRIWPSDQVSIEVPKTIHLIRASEDGGTLSIEDVPADIEAEADGGDLSLRNISGGSVKASADGGSLHLSEIGATEIHASADGGSAVLELGGIREGDVHLEVSGGQAELAFSDQAAFELLADIDSSTRLHSDLELEMLTRTADQIHARFNRGGATIRLDAECAKVVVRREA